MNVQATPNFDTTKYSAPTAEFALVFYKSATNGACVTKHNIDSQGILGDGYIVESSTVAQVIQDAVKPNQTASNKNDFIRSNLLVDNSEVVMWFEPSRKAPMWRRESKLVQYNAIWPALLFIMPKHGDSLYVFSLASDMRPNLSDTVYIAPLANLYQSHNFCQGSATLPINKTAESIDEAAATIYESAFTHFHTLQSFINTPKNGWHFWEDHQSKPVDIPASIKPLCSLSEIVKAVSNGEAITSLNSLFTSLNEKSAK
ncbi:hypothetical protein [Shewanella sp. MBTL60-007]|uniref:hypothetical protein n=1 Tax=Shewanella sp. MBTL60-007 TaxID=2815911 RepID=UPI001BB86C55|nr:hypothetical protein [Shewanella sp. MBTL60-007]GIU21112.1 hypothetical protein TUM3792_21650 [Shewanella sp. MBTL60-007]